MKKTDHALQLVIGGSKNGRNHDQRKKSYIASSDDPLSADIGIIRNAASTWLFDVGNDKRAIRELTGNYTVVLSHFHKDHTGNLDKLNVKDVFVSSETKRHVQTGTIIDRDRYIDHLHLFPLPSSHCKGCLGLEVDETYAFVGDALFCRSKDGYYIFNVQLLKDEIAVLKQLKAPYLLVSHFKGMIRRRDEVIAELEELYRQRDKHSPEMRIKLG